VLGGCYNKLPVEEFYNDGIMPKNGVWSFNSSGQRRLDFVELTETEERSAFIGRKRNLREFTAL
jgi:hypothetical protein